MLKQKQGIIDLLRGVYIAKGLSTEQLEEFLASSKVGCRKYAAGEFIFQESDKPSKLYILIKGRVSIMKDTYLGRQLVLGEISQPGDIFGEVYLFLGNAAYDMYTVASQESEILEISSSFFVDTSQAAMPLTVQIQQNLLRAIAGKAYLMHNRVKILASGSLREKISRYIFQLAGQSNTCRLPCNREQMAARLAVARPSLSRELGKMQQEGILDIQGDMVTVKNISLFESYL